MDFLPDKLNDYVVSHSSPAGTLLDDLERYTHEHVPQPRMISGFLQGRFLSFISKLIRPSFILEIGTYTGYSALCLAEGLTESGELHTIDIDERLQEVHEGFLSKSPYAHQIYLHKGDARQIVPTLDFSWDLVFIDADKRGYMAYYEQVLPNMKKGGLIIADNVLWSGKVIDAEAIQKDKQTAALHAFNQFVHQDPRVENMLLPLRDGLMIARVL
jgi:caffeoyl-CoA O-methyltransferase